MQDKKVAVFGIYPGVDDAERAVDTLILERFANNDISVLLPDNQSSKDFAHEKNTKAPEGTATGAATGGTIGGTLGLLAGIGALTIPGVGPLIAAGPIVATLAGVGVGGAGRWTGWRARRNGHPRIRSQTAEGTSRTANAAFGPLRDSGRHHQGEGGPEAHWCQ